MSAFELKVASWNSLLSHLIRAVRPLHITDTIHCISVEPTPLSFIPCSPSLPPAFAPSCVPPYAHPTPTLRPRCAQWWQVREELSDEKWLSVDEEAQRKRSAAAESSGGAGGSGEVAEAGLAVGSGKVRTYAIHDQDMSDTPTLEDVSTKNVKVLKV